LPEKFVYFSHVTLNQNKFLGGSPFHINGSRVRGKKSNPPIAILPEIVESIKYPNFLTPSSQGWSPVLVFS
jgi:hypothetical protein